MCRCRSLLLFQSSSKVSCFSDAENRRYDPNWGVRFNFTSLYPT